MKHVTLLIIICISTIASFAQIDKWTESLNSYSLDLYNKLKTENDNLFISPLSTYYALVIGSEGAKSETKLEFDRVLHIESEKLSDFPTFFHDLMICNDSSNVIHISNALWIQKDLTIEADYVNLITQKYLSDLKSIDFENNINASNEINNWVIDHSNGLIRNIISPNEINDSTLLVIADAIYFSGKWSKIFENKFTKPNLFYAIDKSKKETEFMNSYETLSYYETADFQFISKNYAGNDKSFCIILPKKRYGINKLERSISPIILDHIFNNCKNEPVKISIPKFKFETSYSLIEPLKKLGLNKAFTPNANFSGITTEVSLMINQINHKAYIEINEEKTDAAASTIVAYSAGYSGGKLSEPKIFNANHPFIFMIIDQKTKGIIFIGRYVQP